MFAHRLFQNLESLRLQLSSLLRSNPLSISEIRITQRGPGQTEWPLPAHRRHVAHRPGGERTICACPAEADGVRRKSAAASRSEHGTTVLHFKKELNPGKKSMVAQDNTDADVLDGNQPWKPWKSSGDQFGRSRADKSLPATGDTNPLSPSGLSIGWAPPHPLPVARCGARIRRQGRPGYPAQPRCRSGWVVSDHLVSSQTGRTHSLFLLEKPSLSSLR